MGWLFLASSLLALATTSNAALVPCLNVCACETRPADRTIRCDSANMTHFPLPVTYPHKSYNFLALTCNNIKTLPSLELITRAFPDLHGIDLQGNPNINCTSVKQFKGKLAVLTDCETSQPMVCSTNARETMKCEKNSCKNIAQLKLLWQQIQKLGKQLEVGKWINWLREGLVKLHKKANNY